MVSEFKVLIQSSLRELKKSKCKSYKYFVVVEETIIDQKFYYLAYYKSKKIFQHNPSKTLLKLDLNKFISIYTHDINKNKAKNLITKTIRKSVRFKSNQLSTRSSSYKKKLKQNLKLNFHYLLFMYTTNDCLLISFDNNDKLRLTWYNLFINLCKNLYEKLKIYEIKFKLKLNNNQIIDVKKSRSKQLTEISLLSSSDSIKNKNLFNLLSKLNNKSHIYLKSRLCFDDSVSNHILLVFLLNDDNLSISSYSMLSTSGDDDSDGTNFIRLHIAHIKRIGHDKSNRFFIELGKRSYYGQVIFIFKCFNYDLASYLHRKTFQFIDKYKENSGADVTNNSFNNSKILTIDNTNKSTRFNSFSSFLNASSNNFNSTIISTHSFSSDKITTADECVDTQSTRNNHHHKHSTLKRYYTLFSRNSSKFRMHVSDVIKRLSLNKLTTNSVEKLTLNNDNAKQNGNANATKDNVCKESRNISSISIDTDYVQYLKDNSDKKLVEDDKNFNLNDDERFQSRSNTDGCIIIKNLSKELTSLTSSSSVIFIDKNKLFDMNKCEIKKIEQLLRKRLVTNDSVKFESGYDTNSLRSSSYASSYNNKDNINNNNNEASSEHTSKNLINTIDDDDEETNNDNDYPNNLINSIQPGLFISNTNFYDTYSCMQFDDENRDTAISDDKTFESTKNSSSSELNDLEPPFQL